METEQDRTGSEREDRASDSDHSTAAERIQQGVNHTLRAEYEAAVAAFTAALRLNPSDAALYVRRGAAHRLAGRPDLAWVDLDAAVRNGSADAEVFFHRGMVRLAKEQFTRAVEEFDAALEADPTRAIAYLNRAVAHDRLGAFEEAVWDCTRAIKLEAGRAAAYLIRGTAFAHARAYDRAVTDLSQAIELDPELVPAYLERARAHMHRGTRAEALADYDAALAIDPANGFAHAQRGIVHQLLGNEEQAVADFVQALRSEPKRLLVAWNHGLGEVTKKLNTAVLADYTEGRRPAPASARKATTLSGSEGPTPPSTREDHAIPASSRDGKPVEEEPIADASVLEEPLDSAESESVVPSDPAESTAHAIFLQETAPAEEQVPNSWTEEPPPPSPPSPPRTAVAIRTGPSTTRSPIPVRFSFPNAQLRPPRAATRKIPDPESEPGRGRWFKPVLGGSLAAVLASAVLFTSFGSVPPQISVHPASGSVRFLAQPASGAGIVLHPIGLQAAGTPHPRATVKEDGTFTLQTYNPGDGAPAGEYQVTVQWFRKPRPDAEGFGTNILPARYGDERTSGLTVSIREGDNRLPPIELTR